MVIEIILLRCEQGCNEVEKKWEGLEVEFDYLIKRGLKWELNH